MMLFTLSMPHCGSWNGQWSGQGNCYAKTKRLTKAQIAKILPDGASRSFYYNFGDGWGASVKVEQVPASVANSAMRKAQGFCGYEWMIDEIIEYGRILSIKERWPE